MGRLSQPQEPASPESEVERVYRAQGNRLWWAMLGFCGDREVASDVVAETFAQALRRGSQIRSLERWVWRAAFRIAAGELRIRRAMDPLTEAGSYEMPEPARELSDALRRLSRRQRQAIVLHYLGDYPVREIATIIGSSTAAVKVHLSQGRKRLGKVLEEQDVRP